MENKNVIKEEYNYEDNSILIPLAKAGDEKAMSRGH